MALLSLLRLALMSDVGLCGNTAMKETRRSQGGIRTCTPNELDLMYFDI
jgi:hypothetical protein